MLAACTTGTTPTPRNASPPAAATPPGPDPCALLTSADITAVLGGQVSRSDGTLPSGIGGRQCTWASPDGRAVVVETRVDADLDPGLRSAGETATSVLDETVATQADTLTRVPDLGVEAYLGRSHVYVVATTATGTVTLVIDDGAGLAPMVEIALAHGATARL